MNIPLDDSDDDEYKLKNKSNKKKNLDVSSRYSSDFSEPSPSQGRKVLEPFEDDQESISESNGGQ